LTSDQCQEDKFVKLLQHDITGLWRIGFKVFRQLQFDKD